MSARTTRRRRVQLGLLLAAALFVSSACGPGSGQLHVGAKSFAEQQILAEVLVALLRDAGHVVASPVPCGDTFACQRALQRGTLDLMVEYTGTGLSFIGKIGADDRSVERVRALYQPLGLSWLVPLGFDNNYRMVVTAKRAREDQLQTISDLARLTRGVRVSCPREFLRRPQDGLPALKRRHGLRISGEPVVLEAPAERVRALLDGKADVAVIYGTDAAIAHPGLVELRDSLSFFPPYEAVVVVRSRELGARKGMRKTLLQLEGRLTDARMRELNREVEEHGQPAAGVAREFLRGERLVSETTEIHREALGVAVGESDQLATLLPSATRAVRLVFSSLAVELRRVRDPLGEVVAGRSRLALVGAERFFRSDRAGVPRRDTRALALAVVGSRSLHLLSGADLPPAGALSGRVGVGPEHSGGAKVATALVQRAGGKPLFGSHAALLRQLSAGKLPAVLLLTTAGDPHIGKTLSASSLRLQPLIHPRLTNAEGELTAKVAVRFPYLRAARIPAETYAQQTEPVATLSSQVVLVGPAKRVETGGGPAGAMAKTKPLTREQATALSDATRVKETPDPILPSIWRGLPTSWTEGSGGSGDGVWLDTILNLLALVFLGWLIWLVGRNDEDEEPAAS